MAEKQSGGSPPVRGSHRSSKATQPEGQKIDKDTLKSIHKFSSIVDRRGRVQFASEDPLRALGYSDQDLLRKPFWEAPWFSQSPESQKAVKNSVLGALEGKGTECRVKAHTKDGTPISVTFNISPLKGTEGDIVAIMAETEPLDDETAQAEETPVAQASSERVKSILDLLQEAYFETDTAERITLANSSAALILGYSSSDKMVGTRTAALWADPDKRDRFLVELSRKGKITKHRATFRKEDGAELPIEIDARLLLDGAGEVIGSQSVFREVAVKEETPARKGTGRVMEVDDLGKVLAMEDREVDEADLEAERRWHSVLSNIPDVVMIVSQGGEIQFINRSIPGVKPKGRHVVGSTIYDYMPSEQHQGMRKALQEVFLTGETQSFEVAGVGPNGTTSWYSSRISPLGSRGKMTAAVLIARDVTEQRMARETIFKKEVYFKALIENISDGISIMDRNGNLKYASPSLERIRGFTPSELIGQSFIDQLHPDDRERTEKLFRELLHHSGSSATEVVRLRHKNGSWIVVEGVGTNLLDNPIVQGIVISYRDITEQKQASEKLQSTERYFRALIENSSDGVLVLDKDGTTRYESPGSERLLGFANGERIGHSVFDPIHPEDRQAAGDAFNQVLSGLPAQAELRAQHKDGSWRTIDSTLTNLLDDPAIKGIVVNMRDITERKQAEEQLRHTLDIERAVFSAASQLTGAVNINDAIDKSLGIVGGIVSAGRVYLSIFDDDMATMSVTHEWCAEGVGPQLDNLQRLPLGALPWGMERLKYEQPVEIEDTSNLPPEAEAERRMLESHDIKAILILPMKIRGHLAGLVGFDDVLGTKRWSHDDITILSVLSELIGNALEHEASQEEMRESEAKYSTLVQSAKDGIAIIQDGVYRFVNDGGIGITGYAQEELVGNPFTKILSPESAELVIQRYKARLAGEQVPPTYEGHILRKDGSTRDVEITGAIIQYQGRPATMATIRDITESKRTAEALKRSEEHFRALIENASDAVCIIDADGTLRYESPAVKRILGYTPGELLGTNVFDLIHPEDQPAALGPLNDFLGNAGAVVAQALRLRHKDGSWRTLESVSKNLLTDPTVHGIVSNYRDITERERDQKALQESEERFRNLMDSVPISIQGYDPDGTVFYWNKASEKVYGYTDDEAIGANLADLIIPPDLKKDFQKALKIGRAVKKPGEFCPPGELMLLHKEGHLVPVYSLHTAVKIEGKSPMLFCIDMDLSERNKAEQELQEREQRFRALIENVSDVIVILDKKGVPKYQSASIKQVLGYEPEEVLGTSSFNLIHPEDQQKALEIFGEPFITTPGAKAAIRDIRFRHKDGSWRQAEGVAHNLIDDPIMQGIVVNYHDVTDREQAEERFRALIENASDAIAVIGLNGMALYESPSCSRILGYEPHELVGTNTFLSLVHPDDQKRALEQFGPAFLNTANATMPFEVRQHHKDGSWLWCEGTIRNMIQDPKVKGIVFNYHNITERKRAEAELKAYQEKLQDALAKLRVSYEELSTPVVQVWDHVLAMPLIGVLDTGRAQKVMEVLLNRITESRAQVIILDVTGVATLDTQVTNHLLQTAMACELLGADCVITGISPDVAQAMIHIGVDISRLITMRDIQEGLSYALAKIENNLA